MAHILEDLYENALYIAHSLFNRNKVTGSTGNLSFRYKNKVYITGSGTCFGRLVKTDFSVISLEGSYIEGPPPTKELPLHLSLYNHCESTHAVIHGHSFYSTLWSCLKHEDTGNVIPKYTPYLEMKLGKIRLIPYAKPGSTELFNIFESNANLSKGFLLQNHGLIVSGKTLLECFYGYEELEESAKIAWFLRNEDSNIIQ